MSETHQDGRGSWVMVPRDPTEEMLRKGSAAGLSLDALLDDGQFSCERRQYAATLAAVPTTIFDNDVAVDAAERMHTECMGADVTWAEESPNTQAWLISMALAALKPLLMWLPTHKHVKRGSMYQLLGMGTVQTETPIYDNDHLVVYRGPNNALWFRRPEEFNDGRFVALEEQS